MTQDTRFGGGRWSPETLTMRLERGLPFSAELDPLTGRLIRELDGSKTLRDALAAAVGDEASPQSGLDAGPTDAPRRLPRARRLAGPLTGRNDSRTTEHAIMDAMSAGSFLLADAISSIQSFISVFTGVYVLLIFAYILTSWIKLPYSPTLNRIQRFLYDVCEPYLRVFRRFLPPFGPLDLSPIVGGLRAHPGREDCQRAARKPGLRWRSLPSRSGM